MVRKNQNGFSPLFILLIVLVVGAIGFGAWYVLKQDNKQTSTTTEQTAPSESPQTQQPTDPSEGGKYLVIKEWNVRALQNATLGTLTPKIGTTEYGNQEVILLADLSKLLPANCAEMSDDWRIILVRPDDPSPVPSDETSAGPIKTKDSPSIPNESVIKVGDNYYLRFYPRYSCEGASHTQMNMIDDAFKNVFHSLEAIN